MSPPADGVTVSLENVVVVATETSSGSAQAYVQDLGGGEYSGMLLYCGSACREELASLHPGDVIRARGTFKMFSGTMPELTDVDATPLGVKAGVVAMTVPASAVGKTLAPSSAEFRRLSGVLVQVAGPLSIDAVDVPELQSSDTCTGGARYRDGFEAGGVYVSLFFNDNVRSCLAGGCRACDAGAIATGHELAFLRGVVRSYKGQGDAVTVVAPADEIDFPRVGSIRAIHAGTVPENLTATVEDAVVVGYNAVSSSKGSLFLQDAGGGRFSGIQLFCTTETCASAAATLARGDVVSVSGKYVRYLATTAEIESAAAPQKSITTATVVATKIDGSAADMTATAGGGAFDPYNQAYVTLGAAVSVADVTPEELAVTCAESLTTGYEGFKASDGTFDYLVADLFAPTYTLCVENGCEPCANPVAADGTFSSVSGILRIGRGGKVQIAPTRDADLAP
jgi:hypothetical protein